MRVAKEKGRRKGREREKGGRERKEGTEGEGSRSVPAIKNLPLHPCSLI